MLIPQTIPPHSMPANQMAGGCISPSLYLPKSKRYGRSDDDLPKTHSLILKRRTLIDDPTAGHHALTQCAQYGVVRTISKFDVRERRQTTIPTRWPQLTPKTIIATIYTLQRKEGINPPSTFEPLQHPPHRANPNSHTYVHARTR